MQLPLTALVLSALAATETTAFVPAAGTRHLQRPGGAAAAAAVRDTRRPGGAPAARRTALKANMFDRFARVAKANVNQVLNNLEDPEKVMNQAVEDLQSDLVKIRQSYAEVTATQKRVEKQRAAAATSSDEWYKRAQMALAKGEDELAREALTRKTQAAETVAQLDGQIATQTESLDKLYESMGQLESKISEAKSMKDQYIARARTAATATKVNDMLSSSTGGTSMDAFDRMKEKVEMLEVQAEVSGEMAGALDSGVEAKFAALEGNNAVDDELASMKMALSGTSATETKQLPSAVDDELAAMKAAAAKAAEAPADPE